jgi:hypothetical protein
MPLDKISLLNDANSDVPPVGVGDEILSLRSPFVIIENNGKVTLRISDLNNNIDYDTTIDQNLKIADIVDVESVFHPQINRNAVFISTNGSLYCGYLDEKSAIKIQKFEIKGQAVAIKIIGTFDIDQQSHSNVILLTEQNDGKYLLFYDIEAGSVNHQVLLPFESNLLKMLYVKRGFGIEAVFLNRDKSNNLSVYSISKTLLSKDKLSSSDFMVVALGKTTTEEFAETEIFAARFVASSSDQQIVVNYMDSNMLPTLALLHYNKNDDSKLQLWSSFVMKSLSPNTTVIPRYKCAVGSIIKTKPTDNIIWTVGHRVTKEFIYGSTGKNYEANYNAPECHFLNVDEKTGAIDDKFNILPDHISGGEPYINLKYLFSHDQLFLSLNKDIVLSESGFEVPDTRLVYLSRGGTHILESGQNSLPIRSLLIDITADISGNGYFSYKNEPGDIFYDFPISKDLSPDAITAIVKSPLYLGGDDFLGKSLRLGLPEFANSKTIIQACCLFQCIPFEREVAASTPNFSFTSSAHSINSSSTTTHSSWNVTASEHASARGAGFYVAEHFSATYGESFSHSDETSVSKALSFGQSVNQIDILVGKSNSFRAWRFPVYIKGVGFPDDVPITHVTILLPETLEPVTELVETSSNEIIYRQDYEIGNLLSYMGADIPGFEETKLLFDYIELDVTEDSGGATLSFSQTLTDGKTDSYTSHLNLNAGLSVGYFGGIVDAGASVDLNKETGNSNTTNVTTSNELSINIHTGSVKDSLYDYHVLPIVYYSSIDGLLIAKYKIKLTGPGWQDYYGKPMVKCMALFPDSKDKILNQFTRSIQYNPNSSDQSKTDISVHLFNNALVNAQNIICEIFVGEKPIVEGGKVKISPDSTSIGKINLDGQMTAALRRVATLPKQDLLKNIIVSVKITHDEDKENIYWNTYPENYMKEILK